MRIKIVIFVICMLVTQTGFSEEVKGLVGYWSMDDTDIVDRIIDKTENNNIGIIYDATWITGKYGSALEFNGTTSFVDIQDSPVLNPEYITVEVWIKPYSYGYYTDFVTKSNGLNGYYNSLTDKGKYAFGSYLSTWHGWVESKAIIPLNTWTHLSITFDGKRIILYVNGILDNVKEDLSPSIIIPSSGSLTIGASIPDRRFFKGCVDEVRIYNRALTPQEIKTDYQRKVEPKKQIQKQ